MSWSQISLYNRSGGPSFSVPYTYTREEIDYLLSTVSTNPMTTVGDMIYGSTVVGGKATPTRLAVGTNGQVLQISAGMPAWGSVPTHAHAGEDVTSGTVAFARLPFTASLTEINYTDGVTSAIQTQLDGKQASLGYTAENAANKNATNGYAGLTSGKVTASQVQEVIALADLTNVSATAPTDTYVLKWNAAGNTWEPSPDAGAGAGTGTVTSAALTMPAQFSIAGSPITTSGTFAVTWASATANYIFAGPDGSSGTPAFRALVAADIPSLATTKITSGTFDAARIPVLTVSNVSLAVDDLTDVSSASIATSQMLKYNGSAYVPVGGVPNSSTPTNLFSGLFFHAPSGSWSDLAYAGSDYPTDPRDFWYWAQFQVGPGKIGMGTAASYSDNGVGGNFHFASYVQNTGTRNSVAGFFTAIAKGSGSTTWAINPVGLVDVDGTTTASTIANETNFGSLGTSTNASAHGEAIYSVANADTVVGSAHAYSQMGVSDVTNTFERNARTRDGIAFVSTSNSQTFTANAGTDVITYAADIPDGTPVTVTSGTTLPAGLVAGKTYFTVRQNATSSKLEATYGGTDVDITSTGTGTHTIQSGTGAVLWTVAFGGSDANSIIASDGSGALITAAGQRANYVINATSGNFGYGIDFAASTFSLAGIRLPGQPSALGAGLQVGISMVNAENSGSLPVLQHYYTGSSSSDGNYLFVGAYSTPGTNDGMDQIRFHVAKDEAGSVITTGINKVGITRYGLWARRFMGWSSATNPATSSLATGISSAVITGSDAAGKIVVSTGTAPARDTKLFTVTFGATYPSAPFIVLRAVGVDSSDHTAGLVAGGQIHIRNISATGFDVYCGDALANSGTYTLNYVIIGEE
jgi:hypothetical protein